MSFIKFTKVKVKFRPKISIRSNGQVGFSQGALNRFGMEPFDYVILYYDKELRKIGVQLSNNKDEEGATPLIKKSGNATISARSFFEFFEIQYQQTKSYELTKEGDLLVAKID